MLDSLLSNHIGSRVEGRGPPVVLLHSSMSSKSQWRELIESLRDSYRLIAIDLLGYGETAMPSSCEGYSLRDEVRLVESVLARELHPGEQFHVIGHSYGGMVALQLARQEPHRVRSLSLFEPIAFNLLPARDPDLVKVEGTWNQIESRWLVGDAHGAARSFVDYWSGAGSFAQLRAPRQEVLAAQVPKLLIELRAVADGSRDVAALRRIRVPTCLIGGMSSPEPAQRLMSMLADALPLASRFEVAAGHMAPITHPALVNPIFKEFLRAVDARASRPVSAEISKHSLTSLRLSAMTRAIGFAVSGILLSVLPLLGAQNVGREFLGIPPVLTYPLKESAWHESPPGMPPGGTFAVISGDPREPGPFVMRVRLPAGYMLPPYQRRNEEQMIVLSGAITVGTSAESGRINARKLTAGGFASLPANELHFAHTQDGAVVQIFGIGPFEQAST